MMRIPLSLWGEKLRQRLLAVCQFAFPPDTQSWATFLKFLCHFVWPYNWIVVSQCGWKRFCYNRFCPWKSPMWFSTFPLSPSSGWLLCQWWWELYLHAAWSSTAPRQVDFTWVRNKLQLCEATESFGSFVKAVSQSSPTQRSLASSRGVEGSDLSFQRPLELWRRDQVCGCEAGI